MPFVTLLPVLQSQLLDNIYFISNLSNVGDADSGVCIRGLNDGKYLDAGPGASVSLLTAFIDPGTTIFPNQVIKNLKLRLNLVGSGGEISPNNFISGHYYFCLLFDNNLFTEGAILIDAYDSPGPFTINNPTLTDSEVMTLNPMTGLAWQRSDLFVSIGADLNVSSSVWSFTGNWDGLNPFGIDYYALIVEYGGLEVDLTFPEQGGTFGGANVEITGSGFSSGTITNVFFGIVPASSIFVLGDTTLSCFSPAHAKGAVTITVESTDDDGNVTTATSTTPIFTYEQYSFTLQTPTATKGDKVKIVTPVAPPGFKSQPGVLNKISQIQLTYIDSNNISQTIFIDVDSYDIITLTPDILWFYLPLGFKRFSGPVTITLIFVGVDSTEFTGSIDVGTLQILFEDASGIYQLDSAQTNDELYFRDGFITDANIIMLSDIFPNEDDYEDDFFWLLTYPRKILARDEYNEDENDNDSFIRANLRTPVVLENVEIPSPFIRTAFLP